MAVKRPLILSDAGLPAELPMSDTLDAAMVSSTPVGNLSAVTVQAALAELDSEKQPLDSDLTAIGALTGTSGFLKKTAADIWALDKSVLPQNGFVNRTDSTYSVVDGTRTFTIQPSSTSFTFFANSVEYTKSTPQTVVFDDIDGLWHFYFDSTGTLVATQTFTETIITTFSYIANVYWDATNNISIFVGEERHGSEMDSMTHLYLHSSLGTQFGTPLGFALTNIVANGSGDLAVHAQIGVTGGSIWDEDIKHIIATKTNPASLPCFYLTGSGVWRRQTATAYPLVYTVGGLANWNRLQTGTWSLVECTSGDFTLTHLFATNDPNQSIIVVVGQAIYTTIALARAGAKVELDTLVLTGFPSQEFVPIATLIWETRSSYNNVPKSRIRTTDAGATYIDWRSSNAASGGGSSSKAAWGDITGLLASQVDLNTALSLKISTTNLKDTSELVYDETNNTLVISSSGTGGARERIRTVNTDTSTNSACFFQMYSGASTNYAQIAQYGSEYTVVAGFAGKSAVQSVGGNLLVRTATAAMDIEFMAGGIATMALFNSAYAQFNVPIIAGDAETQYGNSLIKTALVIDSTKWYRVMTLPGTYCSWADLIIRIPLGHSVYKVRLAKATGGFGIGWTIEIELGGIYNYTTGNISQVRVVDMGPNDVVHLDIKFNGNATRDIELSMLQEVGSTAGTYATLVACTDQGAAVAGKSWDLNYFNTDTTTIGTTHLISNSHGNSFSHLSGSAAQDSRWIAGTTDVAVRANASGMYIGTRSNHPINFHTNSNASPVATIETDGDLALTAALNFGARTNQLINLYATNYGIGVQASTFYLRSAGTYSFHLNGVHSDSANAAGTGGTEMMRLTTDGLYLDPNNSTGGYWFRSHGVGGWYSQTHGGGIHMGDSTFVRIYGSKSLMVARDWDSYYGNIHLNGNAPGITFWDTDNAKKWLLINNSDHFYIYRATTGAEAAVDFVQKFALDSAGVIYLPSTGSLIIGATKVVGARVTGWTAMTGTATRTDIPSDTPTNQQLGRCLKALIDDLITHGLIGT